MFFNFSVFTRFAFLKIYFYAFISNLTSFKEIEMYVYVSDSFLAARDKKPLKNQRTCLASSIKSSAIEKSTNTQTTCTYVVPKLSSGVSN